MNDVALKLDTQSIVVDEVLPHAPETIWKTLTTGELILRWLLMPSTGFEAVKGQRFTLQTTAAGACVFRSSIQAWEYRPRWQSTCSSLSLRATIPTPVATTAQVSVSQLPSA